jgi:hypothetical protein
MLKNFFNKIKIVYLSIQNKLPIILGKIFTKPNLNKVIIIFIVGFISRVFIVKMYNVNVFFEYLNIISILYYSFMSFFIVIIHELINLFGFNIIPSYLLNFYSFLVNILKYIYNLSYYIFKPLSYANKLIFSLNLSDLNISSIRKNFRLYLDKEENTMTINLPDNKKSITQIEKTNDYVLQKNSLRSSRGKSISNQPENIRLPEDYPRPVIRPRQEGGHTFLVDTIRNSTVDLPIRSGEDVNNTVSRPSPTIPNAPNMDASNLSTPSMSTIKSDDSPRFPTLTNAVYSPNKNSSSVTNTQGNNSTYRPVPYSTSKNIPQIPYSRTNNNYTSTSDYQDYIVNNHVYPLPAEAPFFNPARVSNETNHTTIGLNPSNERFSYFHPREATSVN